MMKVPASISFERTPDLFSTKTGSTDYTLDGSQTSSSSSADELQALNTALCFLASINADVEEFNAFLMAHPQALLLEGMGPIPEESARYIVEHQLQRCHCFAPTCHQNRLQVMVALDRGFEYYDLQRWCGTINRPMASDFLDELSTLERQIRSWRSEELILRHRLLETASELRRYGQELEQHKRPPASLLLGCTGSHKNHHSQDSRAILENRVSTATLNMKCVEREHGELLRHIRKGRQVQFAVLRQAFSGCCRHVCTAHQSKVPSDENMEHKTMVL